VLRGSGYGLAATLIVAVLYGVLYGVVQLSLGLIAVAVFGGWLIGTAVRRGVLARRAPQPSAGPAAGPPAESRSGERPWPNGTSITAALLGLAAWIAGLYIAFAFTQLMEGTGPFAERLSPANFAGFIDALLAAPDQQLIQVAVVAALLVVGAYSARAPAPPPTTRRQR
jgi:uncharacterized protein YjeT (DUF2065 family)